MGLRDALRRATSGAYESPSSRTSCEDCGRPYTTAAPMVQISLTPGEPRMRVHRDCVRTVRDRRTAALRAEVTAAGARLTRAAESGDCGAFDAAVADGVRARRALKGLGG
ncbi:hypothetical protein BBK14_11135 [Parafrankia soli]|uniref:Uncharacterized protein n=1 Tax=Parafrankia soli TaxID=2599596 RepID=A0A1S1R5D4_9ACTN|nr:hypothetical protein [Parafrankia soli]OHV42168.1 hypothetical protein BBK14_11135 [Parafrankia soli]